METRARWEAGDGKGHSKRPSFSFARKEVSREHLSPKNQDLTEQGYHSEIWRETQRVKSGCHWQRESGSGGDSMANEKVPVFCVFFKFFIISLVVLFDF